MTEVFGVFGFLYIMEGDEVRPVDVWEWYNSGGRTRRIGHDKLPDAVVSTVFTGVDPFFGVRPSAAVRNHDFRGCVRHLAMAIHDPGTGGNWSRPDRGVSTRRP